VIKYRKFRIKPLDPNKLVAVNKLKEITNPIFFSRNNSPTPDGLLSNDIFGITKEERAGTFAYISLGDDIFMHPLHYKIWGKMDKKLIEIVHGTKKFSINSNGEFVEDENGKSGIKFVKDNIDMIKIKSTGSDKRDKNIDFLNKYKDYMFINKNIVIPAYYRDVNTDGGYVGVGEINKLYNSILIAVKSLKESKEYGLSLSDSIKGRVQELILEIYKWFVMEPNLTGKRGIIKRANQSKTTDYSSRLVFSAPNLKVERLEDMIVDLEHSAVPLSSLCVNFFPYMMFYVRRFFENEFSGNPYRMYITKDNKIVTNIRPKDYRLVFSDERIKKEIDRFLSGYSNRFIPIEIPNEENMLIYMKFKGYNVTAEEYAKSDLGKLPLLERRLTWCDVFFMAATEIIKDKTIFITRYPIDSMYNQFPTKIVVSSTNITEPMIVNGVFIKNYPKIREADIGTNTSNKFVDTLQVCNAYLGSIGGDYDGDQGTVKPLYSIEANAEVLKQIDSKIHYISLEGTNIMKTTNEGLQSLYNLTLVLPDDRKKLTKPIF